MGNLIKKVLDDIGLGALPSFLQDRFFIMALAVAAVVWCVMWFTVVPTFSIEHYSLPLIVFMTVVWYPILEEVLFRGVIQGSLIKKPFGQKTIMRLTVANWLTSLLFVLAHFWYQSAIWALLIIFPSLLYGYFRDRYSSIYPSITLHAFYNGGFVTMNIYAQLS